MHLGAGGAGGGVATSSYVTLTVCSDYNMYYTNTTVQWCRSSYISTT